MRAAFSAGAASYDRSRPRYPRRLFDDLAGLAGPAGGLGAVLEIGCGTGQATADLAGMADRVVAVDLSANMADLAASNLRGLGNVRVVCAAFETWPLPADPFDVVFAGTSFHWLDPAVRTVRAAKALRPGGLLAVAGIRHVAGGSSDLFDAAARVYSRFGLTSAQFSAPRRSGDLPQDGSEFAEAGCFLPARFFRYEWTEMYLPEEFLALQATFSEFMSLAPDDRERLTGALRDEMRTWRVEQVRMRYLAQLAVSVRR